MSIAALPEEASEQPAVWPAPAADAGSLPTDCRADAESTDSVNPADDGPPLPRAYVNGCESPPKASLSLRIVAALSIFGVMYFARDVLMPITVALLVSLTLRPMVRRFQRMGVPRSITATGILFVLVAIGTAGVSSLLPPARQWAESAPAHFQTVRERLSALRPHWAMFSNMSTKLREVTELVTADPPVPVEVHESVLTEHLSLATSTGHALGACLIVLVLVFFALTSGDLLLNQVLAGFSRMSEKKRAVGLVHEVERGIATYLFTVTMINIGLGIASGVGFWLLGMPSPILWGAMTCVLNYVPFFGPMVCTVVLLLVSVLSFDSVAYAFVPPLFFLIVSAVEGNVLTPLVVGRSMSLNPVIVFLALIVGGWAWGLGGAILAVPLLAVVKIATERFPSTQAVARIISA
jgi:predicted PurR-regulated permease PerM